MFSAACCQNASSPLHCTDVRVRPATTVAAEPSSNELLVKLLSGEEFRLLCIADTMSPQKGIQFVSSPLNLLISSCGSFMSGPMCYTRIDQCGGRLVDVGED